MKRDGEPSVPELLTERLRLRGWRDDDLDEYAAIAAHPEVMRYVGGRAPQTREQSRQDIDRFRRHWARWDFGHWAVEERESGRLLGRSGLLRHDDWHLVSGDVEVGWILGRFAWGRGVASEAGGAALRFGFADRELPRIVSISQPENGASVHVMQKLGLRAAGSTNWRGYHVLWYSITRDEWLGGLDGEREPECGSDLLARRAGEAPANIAVEAVLVDRDGRWVLHRRGADARDEVGRLEGLGGSASGDANLRAELLREIREEAGSGATVTIDRFVGAREIEYDGDRWLIASYLCRLGSGELEVTEPRKNSGFLRLRPCDVDRRALSRSALATFDSYLAPRAAPDRFVV